MGIFDLFKEKKHTRDHVYLIEIRFSGFVKDSIRELKEGISRNFHVTRSKIIPHVTLVGPLSTRDEKKLVKEVVGTAKRYGLINLKLDGFDHFRKDVIYVNIKPSDELEELRIDLINQLSSFCTLSPFDTPDDFKYHATIALHDIKYKFDKIWEYVQTWKLPEMEQYVIRITILNERRRILNEYDLMLKKTLDRKKSLDRDTYRKTIKSLEKMREVPEIIFDIIDKNQNLFFFSDAHFDHKNIIRYCRRPFHSTVQMNREIVSRWNSTINENDVVYFLGDMTYGHGRHPIDYWLGKLGGKINYIRGNHDSDIITRANVIAARHAIEYDGYNFLLMHGPDRPFGYDGWIIHGDKHNNSLKRYPFINQKNKTINVCAELVNYTPVSLDRIISLIKSGKSFVTINEPL